MQASCPHPGSSQASLPPVCTPSANRDVVPWLLKAGDGPGRGGAGRGRLAHVPAWSWLPCGSPRETSVVTAGQMDPGRELRGGSEASGRPVYKSHLPAQPLRRGSGAGKHPRSKQKYKVPCPRSRISWKTHHMMQPTSEAQVQANKFTERVMQQREQCPRLHTPPPIPRPEVSFLAGTPRFWQK